MKTILNKLDKKELEKLNKLAQKGLRLEIYFPKTFGGKFVSRLHKFEDLKDYLNSTTLAVIRTTISKNGLQEKKETLDRVLKEKGLKEHDKIFLLKKIGGATPPPLACVEKII